ncbi:MAG TPA: fibronectin type III domain-containing protein, partial [Verrucomicrobiae bacterium]|nr:fibronectin type III domain-containing protein [Verrucomicrobiae bacterium]
LASECYPSHFMRFSAFMLLAAAVCLCGCGLPGAPQPPSLGIPKAIPDLQAFRKGSTVTLTWTEPAEFTDGELLKYPANMVISRGAWGGPFEKVSEVPLPAALNQKEQQKTSATDNISAFLSNPATPDFLFYRVVSVTNRGRTSLPSNLAQVPLLMTAMPPASVQLTLAPEGVSIMFSVPPAPIVSRLNSEFIFRIKRRQHGAGADVEPVIVGQVRPGESVLPLVDNGIEWEKTYDYWVTPVTLWRSGAQQGDVEGDDSPAATILAHDAFPPATPSGLEAVFSGVITKPGVDLTWTPNTEEDLAGYNVYRRTQGTTPVKVNTQLLKTPAFHDADVASGMTYTYTVSAVDLRGNESGRSQEASETVPKE